MLRLYFSPESSLKFKSGKYSVVAENFRSRLLFLFSLTVTGVKFPQDHLAPHALYLRMGCLVNILKAFSRKGLVVGCLTSFFYFVLRRGKMRNRSKHVAKNRRLPSSTLAKLGVRTSNCGRS